MTKTEMQTKTERQFYNNVVTFIDDSLVGNGNSRKLFQKITICADSNMEYREELLKWVKSGCTILLRDTIGKRFEGKFEDYFGAWCSIDSLHHRLKKHLKDI